MIHTYFKRISELLQHVETKEIQAMNQAAEKIAASIQSEGIIHVFGCGHSHILAEEVYYRAGGLAVIHPIFDEDVMLHKDAVRASVLERKSGYAENFMGNQPIRRGDIMIVVSTSGRNPVPIDVALLAKEKDAYIIGISSSVYAETQTSRHESGKFLKDVVDLQIDNHVPLGDAILKHDGVAVPFAPSSTVIGAAIVNSIIAQAIANVAEKGMEPPVLLSGNIDQADERNKKLMEEYYLRLSQT